MVMVVGMTMAFGVSHAKEVLIKRSQYLMGTLVFCDRSGSG